MPRRRSGSSTEAEAPQPEASQGWTSGLINTPSGPYSPESDNLVEELKKAARHAGLSRFRVFVNGAEIARPADLTISSISELRDVASVEPMAEVRAYDRAG